MSGMSCTLAELCRDGAVARAFINEVAENAARTALVGHWRTLGVDIEDADDLRSIQQDLAFVRDLRETKARYGWAIGRTIVGTLILGLLALVVMGLQEWGRGLFPGAPAG